MNPQKNKVLVIEIVEDGIKILELGLANGAPEVLLFKKIGLAANPTEEGIVTNPKLLADTISAFLKEKKVLTNKAIVLVDSCNVFTRISRLAHGLSDEQIRFNLEAELNQYEKFSEKDSAIDFRKIEEISEEGEKKINVLFVAALKVFTGSYHKAMELAGLDLIGMDVPIFSIMRLLEGVDFKASSLDVTLLIFIGERDLQMCILKGNRPRFLHSIDLDTNEYKKNKNDFLDSLVSSIRLVVNFYQERYLHGEEITRIIVFSADAKFKTIYKQLQEKLPQIPIQLPDSLAKVTVDTDKIRPGEDSLKVLDEIKFDFSCLLGSALKVKNEDVPFDVDLLRVDRLFRTGRLNEMRLLSVSLGFILTVIVIISSSLFIKIYNIEKKIARLDNKLQAPSEQLSKALGIKTRMDSLDRQVAEALSIRQGAKKLPYFDVIAEASILVPDGLWLTEISLKEPYEYLIIAGEAKTEQPIFSYISNFSKSDYFGTVELVSCKSEIETIKFSLRCKIL